MVLSQRNVDWEKAELRYITKGISQRTLAQELGVSYSAVQKQAVKRDWKNKKNIYHKKKIKKALDSAGKDRIKYANRIYKVADRLLTRLEVIVDGDEELSLPDLDLVGKIVKNMYMVQLGGKSELDQKEQEKRIELLEKQLTGEDTTDNLIVTFAGDAEDYTV